MLEARPIKAEQVVQVVVQEEVNLQLTVSQEEQVIKVLQEV